MSEGAEATMEAVVRAWVEAYVNRPFPLDENDDQDGWASEYCERVADVDDIPRPPNAWRFHCNCAHRWDDGALQPHWDASVDMSYEDETIGVWKVDFDPGYVWITPYPTYAKILDHGDPQMNSRGDGTEVSYLLGPDVLELRERLAALNIPLLPQEGMGGNADITVVVDTNQNAHVVVSTRMRSGEKAVRHEFRWTIVSQGA